jgi:riboflavin synthase
MFTGLIESVGTIRSLVRGGHDWRLVVDCALDLSDVRLGDSIAVNGACLTVVEVRPSGNGGQFAVDVSAESVSRTTFATLGAGSAVNVERAMQLGGRLGGHLLQGHVDAVGEVRKVTAVGRSRVVWVAIPAEAGVYVVAKGSIAVEGVSLTVNELRDVGEQTHFAFNLIPHTQQRTTLTQLVVGQGVNIETDLIGRYVERLLSKPSCRSSGTPERTRGRGIDTDYLKEHGVIA